ncbi:hypothetical protein HMPREF1317_2407, partial [Schaalia georgiae F0490]
MDDNARARGGHRTGARPFVPVFSGGGATSWRRRGARRGFRR